MKSAKVLFKVFVVFLSFKVIFGDRLKIVESNLLENVTTEQISEIYEATREDVVRVWGAINSDSVLANPTLHVMINETIGTIAAFNVTDTVPGTIDGIRLRSVNNSGVGEIIDGGVGFNFVTFMLIGHSNHFHFMIQLYENYSTSLLTTTQVPTTVINEWGTINYASLAMLPFQRQIIANPGEIIQDDIRVNRSRIIDGIRLISIDNTIASGEIIEGGIGFNFVTVRVISNANWLSCLIELFQNGTYTTTTIPTTQNPELEWGKIDEETRLAEKRFLNYPEPGYIADDNATLSTSGIILGIRLTRLNNTDGVWELIDGGVNKSFVTFNFRGAGIGRSYDFNVEIFGNSAITIKLSIILVILSSILLILFK